MNRQSAAQICRHFKTVYTLHLMLTVAISFHKAGTDVNLMKEKSTGKLQFDWYLNQNNYDSVTTD